ncbi:MAG: TetR/AcrR family transcriptional regulator [Elusimicrobiales bacterium]|jgi:AcrR family transcriptional regulator|nr:TetR/AcrR family transcriptional regulator [Elusimicrobiales bacterium]
MPKPATPKGARTRERLLEASGAVFARKGCAASGVADICAAAGLAVGGFYRYFASKDEIIKALAGELRDELVRAVSALPAGRDAEREALAVAGAFFSVVGERMDAFKALREAEAGDEALTRDFYGPLAGAVAGRLAAFTDGKKAEAHAWALLGSLYFYAVKYLVWDGKKIPSAAAAAAARLCARGLSKKTFPWWEPAQAGPSRQRITPGDTQGLMLAAAEEVFGRCGYHGAKVSEITRKAGFAAGTFYLFFKSKEEALEKVVLRLREALVGRAVAYSAGCGSRVETEAMAFRALFDFIREHPYGYRIMREAEFVDRSLADAYYGYILRGYAEQLKKTSKPGDFSIDDHGLLALSLMGMGHMLGMKRVLWGGFRSMDENELLRAVFEGIKK